MIEDFLEQFIPPHCRDQLQKYILHGVQTSEFLQVLLENNLRDTFLSADDICIYRIHDFVAFLYSYAPRDCWGSPEKVESWKERNGLFGIEEEQKKAITKHQRSLQEEEEYHND